MNPIHSAMATAVDRHNAAETNVIKRMAEQQEIIAELRRQLREVRKENNDLRLKLDFPPLPDLRGGTGGGDVRPAAKSGSGTKALEYLNNRPVLTLEQVAAQIGVKYHSAARYARKGAWQITRLGNQVYVYADQAIAKPESKRRSKKKAA